MLRIADAAWTDLRQAVRRIAHSPWLSLVVIGTLALAIAANTTIFSLLDRTVLRKLATPDPDALVSIGALDARTSNYSAVYLDAMPPLQSGQQFSRLGAFASSIVRVDSEELGFDTGVEGVTAEFFDVLGVRAKAGRLFTTADDPFGGLGVITERLSIRLFGDRSAIGRTISADGKPVAIIGVLGDGFIGTRMDGGDDLFVPIAFLRHTVMGGDPKSGTRAQFLVGRLGPGATLTSARAEVLARWPAIQVAIAASLPPAQRPFIDNQRLTVSSFAGGFSGTRDRYGESLTLVMGLALALLAVGCLNLSGLMLARGLARHHEFAVRVALGVSRARLIQQTLIDGVVLSLVAVLVAVPLAWWASTVLASMVSVGKAVPIGPTAPDLRIMLLAGVVAIGCGLIIGILPARQALSRSMDDVLRQRGTAHRLRGTTRAVLITQIAMSMVLVVGAGLFGRTLTHLYANDLTNRDHEVLFTRIGRAPLERGKPLPDNYYPNLQQQLRAIPGADLAAFSLMYPGWLGFSGTTPMDTVTARNGAQTQAVTDSVSPSLFQVYSIELLRGRDFTWTDADTVSPVVIVNAMLARKLFGSLDVIGERIETVSGASKTDAEIVGVVADTAAANIRQRDVAALYRPLQPLRGAEGPMCHVRVAGDLASVQRGYVETINAQRQHIVRALFTMSMWVDNAVVEQRLIAGMAGVAATLAMALALIGLFGLLAYSVSSRIREIGVRMSIGATAHEVVRMIVREGLVVAIPGVLVGIPLAIAVAWAVRSRFYGVSATDPWTIGAAALLFTATAALASWLPARRASRIQPIDALRQD
jgi:predicted permease